MNSTIAKPLLIDEFNMDLCPRGEISYLRLRIISDAFSDPVTIPIMVARGVEEGPKLGLTAAVHGNELNGIPVIHRLFREIDPKELRGTIIGVPVVNVPSFFRKIRRFTDGTDINHIFPGKRDGNISQQYVFRFVNKLIRHFDYLVDLHTASGGRVNSYYVRADMSHEEVRKMALLQNADIIVHNPPSDGTLRGAADELNIPAITLEIGNPNTFQKKMIRSGVEGVHNLICHLNMVDDEIEIDEKETVICKSSKWIYTIQGGLLTVHPSLLQILNEGDLIATSRDIFGQIVHEYFASEKGIVVGKSVDPVSQSGGRILHLGLMDE